jgi:hypothetical protein
MPICHLYVWWVCPRNSWRFRHPFPPPRFRGFDSNMRWSDCHDANSCPLPFWGLVGRILEYREHHHGSLCGRDARCQAPPHRSVREVLLHTAPTSGNSRKAFSSGTDAFCWLWVSTSLEPCLVYLRAKHIYCLTIAGHRVVFEMSMHDRPGPLTQCGHWLMTSTHEIFPHGFYHHGLITPSRG